MSRHDRQRLDDIAAAITAIREHLSRGDLTDGLVFDAVRVRLIEIGEAVKRLPAELLEQETRIPWREVAGMRDRLAHRYFDTSHSILEATVSHDLPELERAVERLYGASGAGASGPVELAIRSHISAGQRLPTPTGRATFVVDEVSDPGLVLLLGQKGARTPFTWSCLEGVADLLRGRGWVKVGATRDVEGDRNTLDGYLKECVKRQTADYVAVVLERAGLVELDRERPAHVRWLRG